MKQFNDENFLLETKTAQDLYHNHAAKMPIIDYHCHLIPQMVAENKRFDSIAQIWLMGDHYKWRAMRSNGIDERFCTGKDTTDWEKFEKWAETVPYTFRNPLYHWTHLELKTAFGIDKLLNPETAREIYDDCNNQIKNDPKFCPRGMMEHYNVKIVCTTDDPADSLEWHKVVKDDPISMLPLGRLTLRSSQALLRCLSLASQSSLLLSRSVMISSRQWDVSSLTMVLRNSTTSHTQRLRLMLS